MSDIVASITHFLARTDEADFSAGSLQDNLDGFLASDAFDKLLGALIAAPAFSPELGKVFSRADAVSGISACRMLRGALNLPLAQVFRLLADLFDAFGEHAGWRTFAARIGRDPGLRTVKLLPYLTKHIDDEEVQRRYDTIADDLVVTNPHAIYPTSPYRACDGHVAHTADYQQVEAVMRSSTFASIRIVDHTLAIENTALADIYQPLGRCVCLLDENVDAIYRDTIDRYFATHAIRLERLVYRAMEVDKGLATVEKMLGDFKHLGVSRNEPVLIVGGGVLADTGGLACALYGRNTPYVMLGTSIVTGIDAGPSPRTCCDGFGYKNLLGAYHPPIVSLTDRFFFKSLREGWLRHGVAEIIKMAVVKNAELFTDLEAAQGELIETRFGTVGCDADDPINALSQKILGGALRSYIEAEYDNLYETHQCRPHAYGHTWSPGFEIEAGLLHGHAVAIGMGFGAYLSFREGWIEGHDLHRILRLMSNYGLSLWHDILENEAIMLESHHKIIQKRGGNLVAPLPRGEIGQCGYLNDLSIEDLQTAIASYRLVCADYPRAGHGIDPLCSDVGLEDPSTAAPAPEYA